MTPRDLLYGLTADRLRALLQYEAETGLFFHRRKVNQTDIGTPAGWINEHGYRVMCVDGHKYMAHRLAWLFVKGEWPADEIDHVDADRLNNQMCNLRAATVFQNARNKKSARNNALGVKGVQVHETGKYRARIFVDGKHKSLGLHDTIEQASAAYDEAALKYFGEFARSA